MQKRTLGSELCLIAAAALSVAAGCSSDPASASNGGGGGTAASTSASTTSSGSTTSASTSTSSGQGGSGGGPVCDPPGYAGNPAVQVVDSVDAIIVDLDGIPAADLPVQVCGLDICLNAQTDGTGHVHVNAGSKMLDRPAFKYGDGVQYVRFATPLPSQAAVDFATVNTAKLPATGVTMTPGMTATSGDVTLTFPTGGSIEIDTLQFDEPDKEKLRAVTIPIADAPPAVDATLNLELLFGASPFETVFCPAAGVTVPNSAGWPADAEVEFFLHGVGVGQEWAPYGGWTKVSDGKVSADGTTVSGTLPELGVFGVRKKP